MTSQSVDDSWYDSCDDEVDTCDFSQMYTDISKFMEHQEADKIDEIKSMLKQTNSRGYSFLMWCAKTNTLHPPSRRSLKYSKTNGTFETPVAITHSLQSFPYIGLSRLRSFN